MNPIGPRRRSAATVYLILIAAVLTLTILFVAGPVAQLTSDARTDSVTCFLLTGIIGCIYSFLARPVSLHKSRLQIIPILLPAYALGQFIPLPISVVRFISPMRAQLAEALRPIAPVPGYIPVSVAPAATAYHFLLFAACVALFFLISNLAGKFVFHPWLIMTPLLLLAAGEAVIGIIQIGANPDAIAAGTFAIRNHYAGFLEMILPFSALYPFAVLFSRSEEQRSSLVPVLLACSGFGISALLIAAIVSSQSRMGFIAAVLSLLFVIFVGVGISDSRPPIARILPRLAILAILAIALLPSARLVARFGEVDKEDRSPRWRETLNLIRAYPLVGCGLGGYQSAFLKFKVSEPDYDIDYAHNDYLQYFAELGLIGFAFAFAPIAIVLFRLRRAWRLNSPNLRLLALACAGSAVAIGAHSLVDFNLYVPANLFTFAWIFGVATHLGDLAASDHSVEPAAVISPVWTLAQSRPSP